MRHYDISHITRTHRAWDASDYYRRDQQHDEQGWRPDEEDEDICQCGSDLPRDECHEAGPCYFLCRCPEAEDAP